MACYCLVLWLWLCVYVGMVVIFKLQYRIDTCTRNIENLKRRLDALRNRL